ncbi:response regulator, partial [Psychrobacter sp. 1Y1]
MTARILIVEDELAIREMLTFVLEQHGYTTVAAEDYDSALDMLTEPYPDLVLLDWMFP